MRPRLLPTLALAATLFAVACGDQADLPTESSLKKAKLPGESAQEAQINKLLHALLPQPTKRDANKLFAKVKSGMASGNTDEARQNMFALLNLLLNTPELLEPDDMDQGVAVVTVIDLLFGFVLLEPPNLNADIVNDPNGAVDVVTPDPKDVKTNNGLAGAHFPQGAVTGPILVTVRKIKDVPCPLPIDLPQFDGCFEYTGTSGEDENGEQEFEEVVTVGVCIDPTTIPAGLEDLVLLHKFEEDDLGAGVQALEKKDPDFLDCEEPPSESSSLGSNGLLNFARARLKNLRDGFTALFGPRPLLAASAVAPRSTRVGGGTSGFTNIGVALPAAMDELEGNSQLGRPNETVPIDPAVKVIDDEGDAVEGAEVSFVVTGVGGTVNGTDSVEVTTNMDGIARVTWVLGPDPGTYTIEARAVGIAGPLNTGPFIPGEGETEVDLETGVVEFTAFAASVVTEAVVDANNYTLVLRPGLMFDASFEGTDILFRGALAYGNSSSSMLFYNTSSGLTDFGGVDIEVFTPGPTADNQTRTLMVEAPNASPEPKTGLGLVIVRETFAFGGSPDDDFVIVKYTLFNQGAASVSGLHIGQIIDADVGVNTTPGVTDDVAEFSSILELAQVTSPGDPPAGFIMLSDVVTSYRAWSNPGLNPGSLSPVDPSTNLGWFTFLSGGIIGPDTPFGPSDIRHLLSHGAVTIEPGESRVVAFALLGGNDLTDLADNAAAARAKWATLPQGPGLIP